MLGLDCVTQVHKVKSPERSLTSLVNSKFVDGLGSTSLDTDVGITSLRMTSRKNGGDGDSLSVTLEPLESNPTGSYHMVVIYRSRQSDKFNEFVKYFGSDMIENIIKEVEKNV